MKNITKGEHFSRGYLEENFPFANHWSRPRITHGHLFLSFLYIDIGSKSTFIPIDVPGSPRVYHPILHIGDHAHLKGDYYCDHLCLCQICLWIGLLSSLSMATLSCMVSKLAIDKAITPFFNSWVLDLVWCIGLGPRVLFSEPIVFGFRFFFYYISLRRQFLINSYTQVNI